ncbi:MAG TPA: class I SAM-dependent methyltransferase [Candidatus Melainabacteria bacterium]|nr:class I SAM-dependent methyltransferase [Candidatus Melainabacteria bacterium]
MSDEVAKIQIDEQMRLRLSAHRKPLEGVFNIIRFNWPSYALALIVLAGFLVVCGMGGLPVRLFWIPLAVSCIFNWLLLSLIVSFIVYDASDLYKFNWLLQELSERPLRILNLHAGFDETSQGLHILFPKAELTVFDFYSPTRSTEPSIARARAIRANGDSEAVSVDIAGWDLADCSQDLVHLFMAAHELRKAGDRELLFREIDRVLKPGGDLVIVEHLRDVPNFIAFGPGFFHFYPRSEWLRLAETCGFVLRKERKIAVFVRVFYLCKK